MIFDRRIQCANLFFIGSKRKWWLVMEFLIHRMSSQFPSARLCAIPVLTFAVVIIIVGIGPSSAAVPATCDEKFQGCMRAAWSSSISGCGVEGGVCNFNRYYAKGRACLRASERCEREAAREPRRPLPLDRGEIRPSGPRGKPGEVFIPPGGGLLEPGPSFNPQGPAGTGAPVAPRAPSGPVLR